MDSKDLYVTVTRLYENRYYKLRKTVARIRYSFESGELDTLIFSRVNEHLRDSVTKKNIQAWKNLSDVLNTGNMGM